MKKITAKKIVSIVLVALCLVPMISCVVFADVYESDMERSMGEQLYPDSFITFFVAVGFVIPLVLIVVGAVLPNMKKLGSPKYCYGLSVISLLWIFAAAVLAGTIF